MKIALCVLLSSKPAIIQASNHLTLSYTPTWSSTCPSSICQSRCIYIEGRISKHKRQPMNKQMNNIESVGLTEKTWDSWLAVLSPLKSPFKIVVQFPTPYFSTAEISSKSSSSDHFFLFFRGAILLLAGLIESTPSTFAAAEVVVAGRICFWTETGTVMFMPFAEAVGCEFSYVLHDWPLGIFIINGASTVVPFRWLESLGKPEAIRTWPKQPPTI